MGTQGTGRKRSTKKERSTAEDDALNLIAREAEARLAAKRAARAEAREIRMKELERQQKEIFQVQKKYYGLNTKLEDRADSKWGDIEQWMEDSEKYSRPSRIHTLSDDDERMSVGSHSSVRDNCSSVASFLRSTAGASGLPRDLEDITIPDFSDVEDKEYAEKGSRAASALTAATLTSLGGTSSRRGSGETALTVDAESSIREIKEIHELKDQIQDVETKYMQNLKEVKDALAEAEEKYRKTMVSNAQLDNEKNNLMYQVDTLKDSLMELEELLSESRREYEEKVKEFEREKHAHGVLQFQFNEMKETLKQSEELLNEIRQLRLKQDVFVREISDLQETVEWKDKKIGALERQKEYTDAIRIERDELREEVVKLKDILKKHGIILGPDLNINGDVGEAEVDGSTGAEPTSQSAQDSQTSPTEGNSMLGNSELGGCREAELDPEQQREMLEEKKHWSADPLCDVSACREKQETCLLNEEDETDAAMVVGSDVGEENNPETGKSKEGKSESYADLTEAETQSDHIGETCVNLPEEQENKADAEESSLMSTDSGLQINDAEVTVEESLAGEANAEPQPEKTEAVENNEADETQSKSQSQVSTTSGKKKKKKKKNKKKGGIHDDKNQPKSGTVKENEKTEKEAAARNNGFTAEPATETFSTSEVETEQDKHEGAEKEVLPEPSVDHILEERKTTDETLETEKVDSPDSERSSHVETAADFTLDKELTSETEKVEQVDSVSSSDPETSLLALDMDKTESGEVIHTESKTAGVEVQSLSEMRSESILETGRKANTEAAGDTRAAESESTDSSENKDNIPASLPSPGKIADEEKSSSDSRQAVASDLGPEGAAEPATDDGEPKAETVPEGSPSCHDGENSELNEDGAREEVLNGDSEDLSEADGSLNWENGCASVTTNTEAEAVKTSQGPDQTEESNIEAEMNNTDEDGVLKPADSSVEQEAASPDDPETEPSDEASAQQLQETRHEKTEGHDSPQHAKLDNDEEDGEDEEGQSFDFDELDVEAAVVSSLSSNPELDEVEEGVEVTSDEINKANHNFNNCNQADDTVKESDRSPHEEATSEEVENVCEDKENQSKKESSQSDEPMHMKEEGKVLDAGESGVPPEKAPSLVEEGEDAVKLQGKDLDFPKIAGQVVSDKDSGRDAKKGSKKGKSKGKEDCKMS
ncbi:leucine-rich repeat flightless-interacting protein 1 isoform X3 [Melanotaenia boesemani]|uniref:leucine-rich repeat flightless-interacting protein 1 isoform X3 n=1 Tax=Melanotaenia boesemani TaxID=1250792 RepID=UPI001C05AE2D|nr:leucine-rich repeat flightless-interacting protein 1 isoform X3 [Melanotaenia boesemani]